MASSNTDPADFDRLWDYNQPAETELRFRQLLPEVAGQVGLQAELLTQIARCQGLQRQFDQAHRTLDEVERLLTPDLKRARIRYLLERGRAFNSANMADQARPLFWQAWEAGLAAGEDFHAIDAAHMMAIVEPLDQQLAWHQRALELAEKTSDARAKKWPGSLHNNIGWTYFGQGHYEQALDSFQQALKWREIEGDAPKIKIARWCVAKGLRTVGQVEAALEIQQDLWAAEQAGQEDGYVREELGECLLALNQPDAARPHFAAAYRLLTQDPWLVENEADRLARLQRLGSAAG